MRKQSDHVDWYDENTNVVEVGNEKSQMNTFVGDAEPAVTFRKSLDRDETPREAVVFTGEKSEVMQLLDGKQEILAHKTEDSTFIAAQYEVPEGMIQTVNFWKRIPNSDVDMIERLNFVRNHGKAIYIAPENHPNALGIFNPQSIAEETQLVYLEGQIMEFIPGVEDFAYEDGWLCSLENGQDKPFRLVSAKIFVEKICAQYDFEGVRKEEFWKIRATTSRRERCWELSENNISTDFINRLKSMPGVQLANGNGVANSILNFIRVQAEAAPTEKILCDHGWQKIDGNMLYIYDNHAPVSSYKIETGRQICIAEDKQPVNIFMDAVRLFANENVAGPLLAYSVYGILYRVLSDAGINPQTVLFLCGPTGCRKTSVSKVLFRFYEDELQCAPQSFQSTLGSIDQLVNEGRDGILLLDDFCPNVGNADEKDMFQKLEKVIRLYGDNSKRRALDGNHQIKDVASVQGGAVVTGEIPGHGKSSLLRMLTVELNHDDLNLECLYEFQKNPRLWPTFISAFVGAVEAKYEQVKKYVQDLYPKYRKEGSDFFTDGRIVDHYAVMMCCSQVLFCFLQTNQIRSDEISNLQRQFEIGIYQACQDTENLAHDKTAWAYYVEALCEVLDEVEDRIAADKKTFVDSPGFYGYRGTTDVIYFKIDDLERCIKTNLFSKDKRDCFMERKEALGHLAESGIIIVYKNGNKKHSYTFSASNGGISNRMIGIHWDKLQEELVRVSKEG